MITCNNDVLNKLTDTLAIFDSTHLILDSSRQRAFAKFINGLRNVNDKDLSKTTLYTKGRALELSKQIYNQIAPEVLVLCGLTFPMSTIGVLSREGLLRAIHSWWLLSRHPTSLSDLSAKFRRQYSLDSFLMEDKDDIPGPPIRGVVPGSNDKDYDLTATRDNIDSNYSPIRRTENGSIEPVAGSTTELLPYQSLIKVDDLYTFLEKHRDGTTLTLTISEDVNELPSIEIAREMCQLLIKHVIQKASST